MNTQAQLSVESIGTVTIVRLRGAPTPELLKARHELVLSIVKETGQNKILYDVLGMESPNADLAVMQQQMEEQKKVQLGSVKLRCAIVVPNSRIAYFARIAFGEGDYRVFYNDLAAAIAWLEQAPASA